MNQILSIPLDSEYPDWHYCPLRLLKAELQNPMSVIAEFFSAYHLPEARKELKEMLEDAMCSVEVYAINYLAICDNIEKLMEASWLLLQEHTNEESEKPVAQPEEKKDAFSSVIDLLIFALQPERIFLLSGEESNSIDLLIVVPENTGKSFAHYGTIVEMVCHSIGEVNFSLQSAVAFTQHIEECHPFWLSACTKEKQIYSKDGLPFPVPLGEKKSEEEERSRNIFCTGLSKAAFFWESAKGLEEQSPEMALFMLHGAAELTLRALIRSLTGVEVKEHSIRILQKHLRRCAPGVIKAFPDNTDEEKALLTLLDSAYLKSRYADNFLPAKEEVLVLLQKVGYLQDIADDIFTQFQQSLSGLPSTVV